MILFIMVYKEQSKSYKYYNQIIYYKGIISIKMHL